MCRPTVKEKYLTAISPKPPVRRVRLRMKKPPLLIIRSRRPRSLPGKQTIRPPIPRKARTWRPRRRIWMREKMKHSAAMRKSRKLSTK